MPSEAASLGADRKHHLSADAPRHLTRSPHPYRRSQHDAEQNTDTYGVVPTLSIKSESPIATPQNEWTRDPFFDADSRKRRKFLSSTSDSGTEADDERGHLLTGLPAPPLRPRKGLKEGYGDASPLLTPSYIDESGKEFPFQNSGYDEAALKTSEPVDTEKVKAREKFLRRRRAELTRRITETALFGAVGLIVSTRSFAAPEYQPDENLNHSASLKFSFAEASLSFSIGLFVLYSLYPLRIIRSNWRLSLLKRKSWYYIHVPAAFDPAPLLYPILIPPLVALFIFPSFRPAFLLNLILGLSSIPGRIVPINHGISWYHSLHWLISVIPLSLSQIPHIGTAPSTSDLEAPSMLRTHPETLVCVYAIHQVLVSIIGSLTTSSLLPSELQLVSASMINLLFLSISPQAIILETLLWIGGIVVLVSCGFALRWEVALARIPSWRFRRSKSQRQPKQASGMVGAIDECLGGCLNSWGFANQGFSDDGAISSEDNASPPEKEHVNPATSSTSPRPRGERFASTGFRSHMPHSSTSAMAKPTTLGKDFSTIANTDKAAIKNPFYGRPSRSLTMPSNLTSARRKSWLEDLLSSSSSIEKRFKPVQFLNFRSLTSAQAKSLKWLLAVYVYLIVILTIAFPIKSRISASALNRQEPVGWALAYLFGGIQSFRNLVRTLNMTSWIPIQTLDEGGGKYNARGDRLSFADYLGSYTVQSNARLMLCLYCLGVIGTGLTIVFHLSASVEVDTRRKVFHGMMVVMFLPTIFIDPTFVSLALILILAIFLLLDLFRASQLPPISRPLTQFLAPYVDGRDHRGPVIVSHIFLLIGCAVPLWLSLATLPRTGGTPWQGWSVPFRDLGMISGVVCVGMGDAAASLVGRRYGRRRWPWTGGKSLEGSLAFATAVLLGLLSAQLLLSAGGWQSTSQGSWLATAGKGAIAACGSSLTEAVLTGGNDNVIVPVILWLLVKGLAM